MCVCARAYTSQTNSGAAGGGGGSSAWTGAEDLAMRLMSVAHETKHRIEELERENAELKKVPFLSRRSGF